MTTQTARTAYIYTRTFSRAMVQWFKNSLIRDGFMPADLSVASGSAVLQQVWLNVHRRSVNDVQHEVRVMWYQAVEMEDGIDLAQATEKVEAWIASFQNGIWVDAASNGEAEAVTVASEAQKVELTTAPALNKAEVTAARKIRKMIDKNPITKQILLYILQECPTHTVGFCKTAGIHTGTMQATVRNIYKAAGCPKNEDMIKHLKRILMIKTVTQGGWAKNG